jgi:hypothetical protein
VCNVSSDIDGNINACIAFNTNTNVNPNISTNCQRCLNQSSGCSGLAEN